MKILCLLLLVGLSLNINAQTKASAKKKGTPAKQNKKMEDYEMKNYFMVFLKRGPNRTQDSATAAAIQKGHLEHLTKMANEGKMDIAGPFMDDWEVKGICVYNVATKEEVEKLVNMDPAVTSGRLIAEIHPWYAAKGSSLK